MPGIRVLEGHRSRIHQGPEHPGVHVAFDGQYCVDVRFGRREPTHPPTCHVVRLAHGIQFEGHVFRPVDGEQADGRIFVQYQAIRIVVAKQNFMVVGKAHSPLKQGGRGRGTRGHMRVIEPHDLDGMLVHQIRHSFPVGLPAIIFLEGVLQHVGSHEFAHRAVGRVAQFGHQHPVILVQKRHRDMRDSFFGADQGQNLGIGVE